VRAATAADRGALGAPGDSEVARYALDKLLLGLYVVAALLKEGSGTVCQQALPLLLQLCSAGPSLLPSSSSLVLTSPPSSSGGGPAGDVVAGSKGQRSADAAGLALASLSVSGPAWNLLLEVLQPGCAAATWWARGCPGAASGQQGEGGAQAMTCFDPAEGVQAALKQLGLC
jgi:hypothetical protein